MGILGKNNDDDQQGLLGSKGVQLYNSNGVLSRMKTHYNNFIDTVKGIPTVISDMKDLPTFLNNVKFANKYANVKRFYDRLNGKRPNLYFEDLKEGYQSIKSYRNKNNIKTPNVKVSEWEFINRPSIPTNPDKPTSTPTRVTSENLRDILNVKRIPPHEHFHLNRDVNRNEI